MGSDPADLALEALHQIERGLSLAAGPAQGFASALRVLRCHLGLVRGTVSLPDALTGELVLEAAPELAEAERLTRRVRPGEGIVGRVFRDGLPLVVPDLHDQPRHLERAGSRRDLDGERWALYALPLRDGRDTLGVLTAERRWSAGPFSPELDRKVLSVVAGLLAVRIRLDLPHRLQAAEPPLPPLRPEPKAPEALPEVGERQRVEHALARAGHVQARAARLLGMTVRQLRYRIAKHRILVERF